MTVFVKCWHCTHYNISQIDDENSSSICDIKKQSVSSEEKVCKYFFLRKGTYTKKSIPDYCIHYNKI